MTIFLAFLLGLLAAFCVPTGRYPFSLLAAKSDRVKRDQRAQSHRSPSLYALKPAIGPAMSDINLYAEGSSGCTALRGCAVSIAAGVGPFTPFTHRLDSQVSSFMSQSAKDLASHGCCPRPLGVLRTTTVEAEPNNSVTRIWLPGRIPWKSLKLLPSICHPIHMSSAIAAVCVLCRTEGVPFAGRSAWRRPRDTAFRRSLARSGCAAVECFIKSSLRCISLGLRQSCEASICAFLPYPTWHG